MDSRQNMQFNIIGWKIRDQYSSTSDIYYP